MNGSRFAVQEARNGTVQPAEQVDDRTVEGKTSNGEAHQSMNGGSNGLEGIERDPQRTEQDKSDSEAETVVLSGKEQRHSPQATKAIKLEDIGYDSEGRQSDVQGEEAKEEYGSMAETNRRQSLKRKRGKEPPRDERSPNGRDSSALSSTASSPAPHLHSSKTSGSRSDRSRSSPPLDDDKSHGKLRKRSNGHEKRRPNKSRKVHDVSAEPYDIQERRETRSATHFDERWQRSASPPPRTKDRAKSIQSSHPSNQGVSKRRKPAPLRVDRRRKASEDFELESDDSSSAHSHHRLQMLSYTDGHVMSPAKISHKKNRDRSGRTLLARACMQGIEVARRWVREQPQDIDTPDNAGNTPLQIASLAGESDVVALLLGVGCDTTCKNIDLDTPLIDAVENSHVEVVKLLLKAGVDPRQRNAKGQEPLELVDLDDDDAEELREILLQARRDSDATRRQSEDHKTQGGRDADTPSAHASGASPTESNKSPPPTELGGRRRTARSQPTNDALLWVNPEPRRLREEAGKGNIMIVDHILKMRPEAPTDAVLAAVRGGHDDVLGLMIATAALDPDPQPPLTGGRMDDKGTPMLAAIGRGNLNIIQLLLNQPRFDPSRRVFNNLTYPEISEQRKGEHWEEERKMLQHAIEKYSKSGRRSNTTSPRKVRTKRPAVKQDSPEPSSSPHEIRKVRRSYPPLKEESDSDANHRPLNQGTAVRPRGGGGGQEASAIASDQSFGRLSNSKPKLSDERSNVDDTSEPTRADSQKPKRKLMSGNELKTDQEAKRKAKGIEGIPAMSTQSTPKPKARQSFSSHDRRRTKPEEAVLTSTKAKKAASEEPPRPKQEGSKKRLRVSVSPQASRSDLGEAQKKRQRVDSQDKVETDQDHPVSPISIITNIVTSPTSMKSPPQNLAPVAFMGSSTTPDENKPGDHPGATRALLDYDKDQSMLSSSKQHTRPVSNIAEPRKQEHEVEAELAARRGEAEHAQLEEDERQRQALLKEEAEYRARLEREAEEARLEVLRQEEAERRVQMERKAEEARIAKVKRDEEMQRRRFEEERLRREEQERRRREREERESLRRMQQQQEEERARLDALPNGLRRASELGPEQARDSRQITKWLPLRTVTTIDLNVGYDKQFGDEQWIANIQAAPLLANQDLELSQCKC